MDKEIEVRNICCIGAGYVGGPTMAMIAKKCPHIKVNVVDVDENRIAAWNSNDLAKLPVFEPGLEEIIASQRNINLFFSNDIDNAIKNADMVFICVNTPTKTKGLGAGYACDLKYVELCARRVSRNAHGHTVVVEKSTLPVRTAKTIKEILSSANISKDKSKINKSFSILSNPEFLAEGTAINDLEKPDRVLIGGDEVFAINALRKIYLNWVHEDKILSTNLWSSELSKLSANAFLASRISSINSLSALCEKTGADIKEVSLAIGTDSRIGSKFLKAGPGFGGSCFKKDILNLIYICRHFGLIEVANYWEKVIEINEWQKNRISQLIVRKLFGTITDKKILILGYSYKANTNDTRESPAKNIINDLLVEGAEITIHDPQVREEKIIKDLGEPLNNKNESNFSKWIYSKNLDDSFDNVDAVIILTEWDLYKNLNWESIYKKVRKPAWIFDTRLVVNKELAIKAGFRFWQLGGSHND